MVSPYMSGTLDPRLREAGLQGFFETVLSAALQNEVTIASARHSRKSLAEMTGGDRTPDGVALRFVLKVESRLFPIRLLGPSAGPPHFTPAHAVPGPNCRRQKVSLLPASVISLTQRPASAA